MGEHVTGTSSGYSGEDSTVFTVSVADGGSELSDVFAESDGEILEELPFNNLQVRFPEAMQDEIESLESVRAINREGRLRFE